MLLGDRYRIEKELARGGMGIVYLARDEHLLSRHVVIKVLLEESNPDPWLQKKFRQEIEALARIDHPGVVGALDCGETPDGKPYLVMQFVEGVTLRSAIGDRGMDLGRVARILRQVVQALSAAHEKGVYHRDLKPENIMLQLLGESEEHVKLIDFGIATVKDSQVASRVETTQVAGSLAYMAPEQFRGQPSPASDIYALGVVAYEMVTGRRPFPPNSLSQSLEAQQQGVPVNPRALRPDLTEQAEQVILKALSFDPEDRYPGPRKFGEDLAAALLGRTAGQQPVSPTPPRPESQDVGNPLWPQRLGPSKGTNQRRAAALTVSVAAVLVVFGIWLWFASRSPAPKLDVKNDLLPPRSQKDAAGAVPTARQSPAKTSPPPPAVEAAPLLNIKPGQMQQTPVAADWPTFRGSAQRNGVAAVMGPRRPRIQWVVSVGGQLRGSPVLGSDGTVYIGSTDGNLYLIRNGEVVGTVPTGGIILGTPVIEPDGVIHVTTTSGERHSLDHTGRKLGISRAGSYETARSPDGRVYYAEGSKLKALDEDAWRVELGVAASTSPAVGNNGDIYLGLVDGILHCIDRHGQTRWTYRAPARVTATPAVKDDGDVIFGCGDRNLYCLRNGELRWKFPTGGAIFSAPVVDGSGTIYFGSHDGFLYAVTDLGDPLWKLSLGHEIHSSPALDRLGRLYIATLNHQIYCISN